MINCQRDCCPNFDRVALKTLDSVHILKMKNPDQKLKSGLLFWCISFAGYPKIKPGFLF